MVEFRTLDGTCSNLGSPLRQLWGSTGRPHFTYFKGLSSTVPKGEGLPSARLVSNMLCKQSSDLFDSRSLNDMTTFFGQFVDHTIVATPLNFDEQLFIDIPEDDRLFSNKTTKLRFFRSMRVRARKNDPEERAQNSLTSVLDLVSVYGPSEMRNDALRKFELGLMKTSENDLLPLNGGRLTNAPVNRRKFFLAGDHRSNEHPVLTSLHTLFVREHNSIAKELKKAFPSLGDQRLFLTARRINIAQFEKIVFKEWYPAITGRKLLPPYKGFRENVDPTTSLVFSTAAFRVGHTLVGNGVTRRGPGNSKLSTLNFMNTFFRTAGLIQRRGIDEFVRGALVARAQKIDLQVHDALRDFLFTKVDGEEGIDLIAFNLQRGRDHGLPSYNAIRGRFGRGRVSSFSQITKNKNIVSRLQNVYKTVNKVEAWIGMMAEDHAPGSSMGPTLLEVWRREFVRKRDGDQFHYERPGHFSRELRNKIPRVRKLFTNEDTFRAIILRNTDIRRSELKGRMFFSN